jgi:hypothetical protein
MGCRESVPSSRLSVRCMQPLQGCINADSPDTHAVHPRAQVTSLAPSAYVVQQQQQQQQQQSGEGCGSSSRGGGGEVPPVATRLSLLRALAADPARVQGYLALTSGEVGGLDSLLLSRDIGSRHAGASQLLCLLATVGTACVRVALGTLSQ